LPGITRQLPGKGGSNFYTPTPRLLTPCEPLPRSSSPRKVPSLRHIPDRSRWS